jgi:hypothetical protein
MADTIKISNNQDAIYVEVDAIPTGYTNDGIFYKTVGGKHYKIANDGNIRALNAGVLADGTDQTSRINTILAHAKVRELIFDGYNVSITISGTVTVPSSKKLVFRNGCKLIGAGTVDGGIIECDDLKQCFATTITVTNLLNTYVSVKWFGAVAEAYYYVGNGTNNYTAFTRAIAAQKNNPSVYIPAADQMDANFGYFYYISAPLEITERIELYGDGYDRSIIYIPGDGLGIWLKWGSSSSHLHDFGIVGNYAQNSPSFNSSTAHGILVNSNSNVIERLYVAFFSGDGVRIQGDVGGTPYTNANNNKLHDLYILNNGRAGLYFDGGDSNNCYVKSIDSTGNARVNIWDSSFLGNVGVACHTASASHVHPLNKSVVSHGGQYYLAIQNSLGVEPGVTSGWADYWRLASPYSPSFSNVWAVGVQYYLTAGYYFDDPNQLGIWTGCYGEQDQNVIINDSGSMIMNGFTGLYGNVDGAIGMHNGTISMKSMKVRNYDTGASIQLANGTYPSMEWLEGPYFPFGFSGSAIDGIIKTTYASGITGSDSCYFVSAQWAAWQTIMGRDRSRYDAGTWAVQFLQRWGTPIGYFNGTDNYRMISFGTAAPTSGEAGIGDIVLNLDPTSPTLFWQCSVASVAGNGGTWIARSGGGGGGTPGGSSGDIQYNNAGAFGGFGDWSGTALSIPGNVLLTAGTGGAAALLDFGLGYGSPNIYYYNGGAGGRYGVGIGSAELQFFIPSSGGAHISFNTGGDMQASGTNEIVRIDAVYGLKVAALGGGNNRLVGRDTNSFLYDTGIDPASLTAGGVDTLNVQYTDAANSGTSETDLMSYTIPASTFTADGDRIQFRMAFSFASNTNNKTIRLYLGSATYGMPANNHSAGGPSVLEGEIIRTGSNTLKINYTFSPFNGGSSVGSTSVGSVNFASTQVLKATGQSDTASNDITQNSMTVTYYPI